MRTSHVADGWTLDEEAAERTLRYFRQEAVGQPVDEAEEEAVRDFLGSHGQSLDWVFRGDPGGMICRLAATSEKLDAELLELAAQLEQFYPELIAAQDTFDEMEEISAAKSNEIAKEMGVPFFGGSLAGREIRKEDVPTPQWKVRRPK